MSILGLFHIGSSTLYTSQAALTVASNNIANMNTPGYSKQDIVLSIANPGVSGQFSIGTGVTLDGIKRSYDKFVQAQLMAQTQNQGKSATMDSTWGQIEQVFNESQGAGYSAALTDFFNAWNDVATNPSSAASRMVLLQKAKTLTATTQSMEQSMLGTLKDANTGIADAAQQVNGLATSIAQLNTAITKQESSTGLNTANDLRDARDEKMNELAKLVDFSSYEDKIGSVTIAVGMRNLVSGNRTNSLSSATNSDGNQDLYLDGINISATMQGGQIGGLIAARNDINATALPGLRKLAASLTQQVNNLHESGFGLDGTTANDFFAPLQLTTTSTTPNAAIAGTITDPAALTLDEYKISFDAGGNYTVTNKQTGSALAPPVTGAYSSGGTISLPGIDVVITGTVTPADSFTVSPLASAAGTFSVSLSDPSQIAASSTAAGIPGDNSNAVRIAHLADAAQTTLSNSTFATYYSGLVATVGVKKQAAADGLTFDNNLLTALQTQRDSISGVSLDEEAANLTRYQRSYQAGARMITVADQLLQTVLAMGSGA